ncbi:3-hydroxyacyl-CoA dehydrogenase PaaH [Rhodospirillum sp. A1_3_36]|uniref:3-hydroxyacyl-CoA dehydrogenase PaaH n=1 Tax=Rhodospirillum sp. A1_3_36 TaxID=3391666 RepID=UPI0039A61CF6
MGALSPTETVAVIGAGTMGAGIAQVAATAGHAVLLFDAAEGAAERGLGRIAEGLNKLVARGKMEAEARESLVGRIRPVGALADLAPARLVIEGIIEDLGVKRDLFAALEDICGDQTILATNTSSISITAIAAGLKRPERLVGMHFFNPAPVMKLVEVVSGLATDPAVAETIHATATAWKKQAVYVRSTPGFIVNRVARPFYAEALRVLEEGATDVATIDAILTDCGGFAMGPFALMDLIGNDVNLAVTQSVFDAYNKDPRYLPSLTQLELVRAGRLGRKTGRGFHAYGADAAGAAAPTTAPSAGHLGWASVTGGLGPARALAGLINGAGTDVTWVDREAPGGRIEAGDVTLALTDGRSATLRARDEGLKNLVLFDLALDYATCTRVALAPSDQCSNAALDDAVGLFQSLGKAVSVIDDVPGLIVMRTVAMLANEAADAVLQGVCDAEAVDIAMRGGVNYPRGPLAWAEGVGLDLVEVVLRNLHDGYGWDRYRCSPLLRRAAAAGRSVSRRPVEARS